MDNLLITMCNNESISSNDILNAIENTCYNHGLNNGLDDLYDCKSGRFSNILRDTFRPLFDNGKQLYNGCDINTGYNIKSLNILLDIYIYICSEYDKYMSIDNFFYCIGLNNDNYMGDNNVRNSNNLINFAVTARKKIDNSDNIRMQQRASDSKQALLNITYSNYRHNWGGQIRANDIQTTVKTLDDIKRERVTTSADNGQNARFSLSDSNNTDTITTE